MKRPRAAVPRSGKARVFAWDPCSPTARDLRTLQEAELSRLPNSETRQFFRQRQRPCRAGKTP